MATSRRRRAEAILDGDTASEHRLVPRPLVQHPHALADRQPNARPVLGGAVKDAPRLVEIAAGAQHQLNPQPVAALILDLLEVAVVLSDRRSLRRTSYSLRLTAVAVQHRGKYWR